MESKGKKNIVTPVALLIAVIVAAVMILGTVWMAYSARQATNNAVSEVSRLYMDELTGRREQVVASNLQDTIKDMNSALELMSDEDRSDQAHLQVFQARMKKLFELDKFAFVDSDGMIYTSSGNQNDIQKYSFDYKTISGPEISETGLQSDTKKVIIAIPVDGITIEGKEFKVCFIEKDMQKLFEGLSLQSDTNDKTFCNIYTKDGVALTNMVLGGLASEDNLLDAMKIADYDGEATYEDFEKDFISGKAGVVSFDYGGIRETLDFVPVEGTDWMLTYLIRESVISDQISDISRGLTMRSLIQMLLIILALLIGFAYVVKQARSSAEAAARQEEMEQRLALQDELLDKERQRARLDRMITAMAADYRSVFYVDLDENESVCYRSTEEVESLTKEGDVFPYLETFTEYVDRFVAEEYREGFYRFLDPENIRESLRKNKVITYRYIINRDGIESYEMLRFAGVRKEDSDEGRIHVVGAAFADIDQEMREQMDQSRALGEALMVAEEASKAKTAFLSNMSHEIRTPMNAIIGLDSIALNDPDISDRTRENLEKIGGSARHLLGLINDILDVSRIESGNMVIRNEEFSFPKLLEQINTMVSTQCQEKGLDYTCNINGEVRDRYIGDDMKLKQIILNILSNAVKFTPEGGSVTVDVEQTAAFDGKTTLQFRISDTGIGMDKEFIPKMFEMFSQEDSSKTNKFGSTGLGMAITKSIVEMMNGTLEVESEKGVGTTFTVQVTLADAEGDSAGAVEKDIRPEDLSVLIVDDDPVACEHAELVLKNAGIAAESVMTGAEAVEKVKVQHARREPYNLILIDWKMPEMDGVETSRQIRSIVGGESAIIILTAYNWDDVIEEAISAGVDSFLAKPLFAGAVMDEFGRAVKRRGASDDDAPRADLEGKHILLAEDMAVNAEIMKEVMKMRGITVDHAENGRIAVDKFASSEEGYYDAVLMDIRMPKMDGLEATTKIRALGRGDAAEVPIIALTANAFDEDVQQSLQAGLNAHLSKPVEPDDLFTTLEELIGARENG